MYWVDPRRSAHIIKILIFITVILCSLLYIVDFSTIQIPTHYISFHLTGQSLWNWEVERLEQEKKWDKSYFVNTKGCKMPSLPVWTETIGKYVTKSNLSYNKCKKGLIKSNNNYMWIELNRTEIFEYYNITNVEKIKCFYRPLYRKNDRENWLDNERLESFYYGDIVKIKFEFIKVSCTYDDFGGEFYNDYQYFVRKDTVNHQSHQNDRTNILIIGIDSVSRLNFHRNMKKSAKLILEEFKAIELFGYNKVEDNTYPNLVPVLTGLDEIELSAACVEFENSTFDDCRFIWNKYKEKGYRTMFFEDTSSLGLFNYFRGGFAKQPTDHYIRPIITELEKHNATKKIGNMFVCLGYRKTFDLFLDYITKFTQSLLRSTLYFAFFWSSTYTHDYLNDPQSIDDNFASFLTTLMNTTNMNNTFLFLMSDHGIRFGSFRNTYQGMMEERQPFLYVIPPPTFPVKYPEAMKNLLTNRRKLATHFDLYETLNDLTEPSSITSEAIRRRSKELLQIEPLPRGISLFLPIPPSRTCYMAGIAQHWCTCHENVQMSKLDSKVVIVARRIVDELNRIVKPFPQCQMLSLNSISDARLGVSNVDMLNTDQRNNHFSDVTLHLETKPGFGQFEATVRVQHNGSLELTGTISRTNLYGKQSQCVDDYKVKLYCFCDSFL